MIRILKASAGSGKTHRLAQTYIDLLLNEKSKDDCGYRSILAVTFTNKATDEMKGRILEELYKLSKTATPKGKKAGEVLKKILHDYSAFAVSTIDKFFQQTLRAFAHESGQMASYQVELDKDGFVEEVVDNILDSLNSGNAEDERFINYLLENIEQKATDGKVPSVEEELKHMAGSLMSERFTLAAKALGLDMAKDYSMDGLARIKKNCRQVMETYEKDLRIRAKEIVDASERAGLQPEDYSGGSRSWFCHLVEMSEPSGSIHCLTDNNWAIAAEPERWFSKTKAEKLGTAKNAIGNLMADLLVCRGKGLSDYNTAGIILKSLFGLGIAARLTDTFERLRKEKNILCLDESNLLLKDIIDGSDAPFVYERIGVRLKHYLLDEFQDTSETQWKNFLPLLKDSDAKDELQNGTNNLIVGDVKQSIYRWRGSDWNLLDRNVKEEFPRAQEEPLDRNYRSDRAIVDFNNEFYPFAAKNLDGQIMEPLDGQSGFRKLSEIYADVHQEIGKAEHEGKGFVNIRFIDKDSESSATVEAVKQLLERNIPHKDIAVLVRKNEKADKMARVLAKAGIPVVTEDALSIKSVIVCKLVDLMAQAKVYHSLISLCDETYAKMCADETLRPDCECEAMYVAAFADYLMEYCSKEGNDLRAFLSHWEGVNPTIKFPLVGDSVRLLTIHKSKGLAFPYVILPYVEDVETFHRGSALWTVPEVKDSALSGECDKLFYVSLSKSMENSRFSKVYHQEKYSQAVDAINMMYVATTRAKHGMTIICTEKKSGTFADVLKAFCDENPKYLDCPLPPVAVSEPVVLNRIDVAPQVKYLVYPLAGRLTNRPYARDFFLSDSTDFENLPARTRGVILHNIMSRVICMDDLEPAVEDAVRNGSVSHSAQTDIVDFLSRNIASHPEYFRNCDNSVEIITEASILASDGTEHRPDRVIFLPTGKVVVVDYKFGGEQSSYEVQIHRYKKLFEAMGYAEIEAELWYFK